MVIIQAKIDIVLRVFSHVYNLKTRKPKAIEVEGDLREGEELVLLGEGGGCVRKATELA